MAARRALRTDFFRVRKRRRAAPALRRDRLSDCAPDDGAPGDRACRRG
jgi:hypothetical protein